jgi:RNA polymerase sigma-70 factor (ECF subfamily)
LTEQFANDSALWTASQQGDQEAFRLLFKTYYPSLFSYGCKLTTDRSLLEDAIQELFSELWTSGFKTEVRSVKAYLYKSLQYKLFKRPSGKRTYYPDDDSMLDIPFTINRETLLVQAEEDKAKVDRIANAMNQLSNRQREIIYLRFYKNFSYEEISEIMEINYQAARNLVSQAIKAMRKLMLGIFLQFFAVFL